MHIHQMQLLLDGKTKIKNNLIIFNSVWYNPNVNNNKVNLIQSGGGTRPDETQQPVITRC